MAQELDEYQDYAPKGTVEFLYRLSEQVAGQSFLHISAGRYGGGMAEILRRLVGLPPRRGDDDPETYGIGAVS